MLYDIINHQYKPGETISAVIKYYNGYNLTEDQLSFIMREYYALNDKGVPRVGTIHKIPILELE